MNIKNGLNRKTKENKKLNDCRRLDKTVELYSEKIQEMMKFRSYGKKLILIKNIFFSE